MKKSAGITAHESCLVASVRHQGPGYSSVIKYRHFCGVCFSPTPMLLTLQSHHILKRVSLKLIAEFNSSGKITLACIQHQL